jgi:DNA-binding XRE family transcriptional regulator
VRPAWAQSYGNTSRRKMITTSEAKRNCIRATECVREAGENTPMYDLYNNSKQIHDPDVCLAYVVFVRAARNSLSLSQSTLAGMLSVHRTTLVILEKVSPPLKRGLCISAVSALAQAGVSCEELMKDFKNPDDINHLMHAAYKFNALCNSQKVIDQGFAKEELVKFLVGSDFVAPLQEKPLRRK